jgi:hypothetical protein
MNNWNQGPGDIGREVRSNDVFISVTAEAFMPVLEDSLYIRLISEFTS